MLNGDVECRWGIKKKIAIFDQSIPETVEDGLI